MTTVIFVGFNIFILIVFAITMAISNFNAEVRRKLLYGGIALVVLPVVAIAIANAIGFRSHIVEDLVLMRGGGIGIPVVLGYGILVGLALNRVRRLIFGDSSSDNGGDKGSDEGDDKNSTEPQE